MKQELRMRSSATAAPKKRLLVLIGQTAVGKTELSLQLAAQFQGEIISADSRLFYQGMDIGTAKPAPAARRAIAHHLIDICRPDEIVTLGDYQDLAYQAIDAVHGRQRLPVLVGGTGQYVMAVVEGWGIPRIPPQPALRTALAALGGPELARWLQHLDPTAAGRIDPRNVRRVVRALEVTLVSGRPITALQHKRPPPYSVKMIGLRREREGLYRRINERVDQMMEAGLLDEVSRLRGSGYGRSLPALSGLGYRQLYAYLEGEMTLAEAVERIKFETHRFARQQNTWFRADDPAIAWFDLDEEGAETAVVDHVAAWL